jgi:hypothetical protein
MNSCDFCKVCWTTALIIGAVVGGIYALNNVAEGGKEIPCWEAHRQKVALNSCKNWEKKNEQ